MTYAVKSVYTVRVIKGDYLHYIHLVKYMTLVDGANIVRKTVCYTIVRVISCGDVRVVNGVIHNLILYPL